MIIETVPPEPNPPWIESTGPHPPDDYPPGSIVYPPELELERDAPALAPPSGFLPDLPPLDLGPPPNVEAPPVPELDEGPAIDPPPPPPMIYPVNVDPPALEVPNA